MASSSGSSGVPFPKWQIALALGATGAIGLGYWYLRHNMDKTKKNNLLELSKKMSSSIDDTLEVKNDLPKTQLEKAIEFKVEGNDYFKKAQYDKAISCYSKAIKECPLDNESELATFYQNRAAAYEHLKNHRAVIEDCTKALEFKYNYTKALFRRARAYEATKQWNKCLDDVTAICLLHNFQEHSALILADRALKELGKIHAANALARRVPITPSKHFIKTYFSSFSEDPAYNLIMSDLKVEPEQETKGFLRARKAFKEENFEEIIAACTEEIDTSEAESQYKMEALLLRGTFHLFRGSRDEAVEDLEAIINNEQADTKVKVNALIKKSSMYMQLEKQNDCLDTFNKAAELGPHISDVFHHRGQVHLLMDRIDEAADDFKLAVELNPNFPVAFVQKCYTDYRKALFYRNIDQAEKCMSSFLVAMERFPKCPECFILYAQILAEQQQFQKAEEFFDKALALDKSNVSIYVHKGLLSIQWTGDTEKAVKLINLAIEKDPLCEFAYETSATVEVQRGNLQNAIASLDMALKLAKTELEMTHLFSLRDAATSQLRMSKKLGITLPIRANI